MTLKKKQKNEKIKNLIQNAVQCGLTGYIRYFKIKLQCVYYIMYIFSKSLNLNTLAIQTFALSPQHNTHFIDDWTKLLLIQEIFNGI